MADREFLVVQAPDGKESYQARSLFVTAHNTEDAVKKFVHMGPVLVFEISDGYRWTRGSTPTAENGWR